MSKIIIASTNQHKIIEVRSILSEIADKLFSPADLSLTMPDVVEDGDSFSANAIKKAVECAKHFQQTVLADDSGLEVFALNGAPGLFSSRYAGKNCNDADNRTKLLFDLQGKTDRRARFVCVVALANANGLIGTAEGIINGEIIFQEKGSGGFGYDPLFVPENYQETFAELSQDEKNKISHRARALLAAKDKALLK